jgi:acid phosphatase (class A)
MKLAAAVVLGSLLISLSATAELAPPPARGSAADLADLSEILHQQAARTDADCARAAYESDPSLATMFGPPYGPLNPDEVAALSGSFVQLREQTDQFVRPEKHKWQRLRPYLEDDRVQPCANRETSFAYPSGHATISQVFALALERIYPERDAASFEVRAHQVGDDRVLAGVHHPTDIEAGRQLARELFAGWLADPAFAARLEQWSRAAHSCSLPAR